MCILQTMVHLCKKQYQEVMDGHTKTITRMLFKEVDVDEQITKFEIPQQTSPMEIKACFEKAYWKLKSTLSDDIKELTAATLWSVPLNYFQRKGLTPPKALLRAINQLKRQDDIVIT